MSELLNRIRSQVGEQNLSTSCSRDGCRVFLADVPSDRVIVDLDKVFPDSKDRQGDYVLFFVGTKSPLVTVPMELKSGRVDSVSGARAQLQQAASHADALMPASSKPLCRPILFHGRRLHRTQRDRLNNA